MRGHGSTLIVVFSAFVPAVAAMISHWSHFDVEELDLRYVCSAAERRTIETIANSAVGKSPVDLVATPTAEIVALGLSAPACAQ